MPDAEIIAIGSELLTPQRLDTNSLYLTDQLNALGVEVVRKTVVGDERERLIDTILGAVARSQIIVLTGGLGPTEDDLTRDAVAGALGRALVFHQDICDQIEERFRRFGRKRWRRSIAARPMSSKAPRSCPTIAAPRRANGSNDGVALMLLPGPPNELKSMFEEQCLPRLEKASAAAGDSHALAARGGHGRIRSGSVDLAGVHALPEPGHHHPGGVGRNPRPFARALRHGERSRSAGRGSQREIEPLLGDRVYSRNGDSLEKVVGDLLRARRAPLSVAESATGGLLGGRITAVPTAPTIFWADS